MATRTTTATVSTTTTESRASAQLRRIAPVLLLVPGLVLGVLAHAHFRDGLATDAAIPVPVYMVAKVRLPRAAYWSAAEALSKANPRNGEAAIAAAEARKLAGEPAIHLVAQLNQAVSRQPASARGWTLLGEALHATDNRRAPAALSQALLLAPRDFFLVRARAEAAARNWNDLDSASQAMALQQVRYLWQEPRLRRQLRDLTRSPEGAALISRSFGPDEIRRINRWLARERRELPR